jgi:hypothetical protein
MRTYFLGFQKELADVPKKINGDKLKCGATRSKKIVFQMEPIFARVSFTLLLKKIENKCSYITKVVGFNSHPHLHNQPILLHLCFIGRTTILSYLKVVVCGESNWCRNA